MIQWALIATAVAAGAVFALVKALQSKRAQTAVYQRHIDQLQSMVESAAAQIRKRDKTIEVMKEANANAAREISEMRKHADPADRARAATDKLRDIARRDRSPGSSPAY